MRHKNSEILIFIMKLKYKNLIINMSINSFDIFDTLLARKVKNPTDIFDIVEKTYPYSNFKSLRIEAQNRSNHTMDSIYHNFALLTNENDETIKKLRYFELKTEMENTIPIITNILKINDGDIFVSDMYLSSDEIRKLLQYHNINSNTTLYVSSDGKHTGSMWHFLHDKYSIKHHFGDNYHSDIVMSSKYNILGVLTNTHKFSCLEESLIYKDFDLCTFFRVFRLMNKYEENTIEFKLYEQQVNYNIPLLILMCKKLENILINENRDTVLFLSRDGCLIYKLFSYLYPQYKSIYTHSSRIINQNYNDDYASYFKNIFNKDKCLLFDLHGSFKSGRDFFIKHFGILPRIFIFDLVPGNFYNGISYFTNITNNVLETLSQDLIGSLINFKNNKPINLPTETDLNYIKIMHETVDEFINYIGKNKDILSKNILSDDIFWSKYYLEIVIKKEPLFLNNIGDHKNHLLTNLANMYDSDKGDKVACAHNYTKIYEEIISDILRTKINKKDYSRFDLLEIGLNRTWKGDSIPSLVMWNEYFYNNINITGFDIQQDFIKFNSNNIQIVIGDQSNANDLNKLKNKLYDMIIDDGSHISSHQQISFKNLWQNIKSCGCYVIEDLHYQPNEEKCIKTKYLFENWKNNNWIESDFISREEIDSIKKDIVSINFGDSESKNPRWGDDVKNAFVYIIKK